ncbi:CynX/NimT family MFS transporter [Streptomyces sp. AJS327]|uniref:CynX/NimT family MFS transporter n=1 Tax=Streptomyces sp. AJS327 TaxID=2545265 RepID=UPI0035B505BA
MVMAEDDLDKRAPGTGAVPPAPRTTPSGAVSRWGPRLVVIGLVLAALNLRPAISGLGPLLAEVRDGLGMNGTVAGLLTSVPPLCFAVFGPLAPRLARRWGPAAVVLAGMAAITLGLALRPLANGTVTFLAASALALAGIAVGNVLMPVVVKRWFPDRVGAMTGLYSMALAVGTSLAAAVTVPMTQALGGSWRVGLATWAFLALGALVPWAAILGGRAGRAPAPDGGRDRAGETEGRTAGESPAAVLGSRPDAANAAGRATTSDDPRSGPAADPRAGAPEGSEAGAAGAGVRIARSPTAWALGVFFGLQASAAYITMGWLPQIFRDAGVPASSAGLMLAVTMGTGIPLSFVLPKVAVRMRHQGPLVIALSTCGLASYAGLWFAPGAGSWLWAILLGVSNCTFPLVLTLIGMRARTADGVVKLSAFAQSTGYLISVPGPLLVGALHDASGGWRVPLVLMTGLMLTQMAVGVLAGRDRVVEDDG